MRVVEIEDKVAWVVVEKDIVLEVVVVACRAVDFERDDNLDWDC